jgi:hypothetical protein
MPLNIEDYAIIGDCETAALVGRAPSVEKWRLGHPHDTPPVPFAFTNFRAYPTSAMKNGATPKRPFC